LCASERRCVPGGARARRARRRLASVRAGRPGGSGHSLCRWPPAGGDLLLQACAGSDLAYDSLLRSRRQALHRSAALALIAAQSEPEAIARHFTEAGARDLAIEWWGKAGEEALRRSAFKEAIAQLGKAIALADEMEREAPKDAAR